MARSRLEQLLDEMFGDKNIKVQLTKSGSLQVVSNNKINAEKTKSLIQALNASGEKTRKEFYRRISAEEEKLSGVNHVWSARARKYLSNFAGITDASASKLGDMFEGYVAVALYNLALKDSYTIADTNTVNTVWTRRIGLLLNQIIQYVGVEKANAFSAQCQKIAESSAQQIWPSIRDDYIAKLKKNEEEILLTWLGGSGGIGDLRLLIGDYVIMIECKYYAPETTEKYGTHYFNFSDDKGNFGEERFWQFLQGNGFWRDNLNTFSHEKWLGEVMTTGFQQYLGSISGAGKDWKPEDVEKALITFNYILSKATANDVSDGFAFEDGKKASRGHRAMIAADKVEAGKTSKIAVVINLKEIFTEEDKEQLSAKTVSGVINYYKGTIGDDSLIGTFGISSDSKKTISNNSLFENPMIDGIGWKTSFDATIYRNRLFSLKEIK